MNDKQMELGLEAVVVAKPTRAPKAHTYFGRGCPILPIGLVNLTTAKNAMFGTMWHCWDEGKGTNILVEEEGKFKVVHTSGEAADYVVGDTIRLAHDQTGAHIGFRWTVRAITPHTSAGLLEIKKVSGRPSVAFATFK